MPQKLDHPPGAGADIEQAAQRPVADQVGQRGFDLCLGQVQRPDGIPLAGMLGKEICRALFTDGADRIKLGAIGSVLRGKRWTDGLVAAQEAVEQTGRRLVQPRKGGTQEHPASFLVPFGKASFGQDAHVPRHPRLALVEHGRQFAHRKLHHLQQQHDAQRLSSARALKSCVISMKGHIKKSLYVVNAAYDLGSSGQRNAFSPPRV